MAGALDMTCWLQAVKPLNKKGEYYLTDIVAIARDEGKHVAAVEAPFEECMGINSRAELAAAEAVLQKRLRAAAMESGVAMLAPETVFFSHDTQLAPDVSIGPYVVFGPGVSVAAGAEIKAFSHLEGCTVGEGAIIGPYARLRPGADIGEAAHIGNFCRGEGIQNRQGRESQSSFLYRRCRDRRENQYRRRHHHLQLRRQEETQDENRRPGVRRLQYVFGGTRPDWR